MDVVTAADEKKLSGKLLVAADGQNSAVRQFLNIGITVRDYQQAAILCHIKLTRPHQQVAYERFTPEGPLAILPISGEQGALVWTMSTANAERLLSLPVSNIEKQLQRSFGYRLGKIQIITPPIRTDLKLVKADRQIAPGTVLLGNAVHTLHPVAGQGLNLALRDLAVLAEELTNARANNRALGGYQTLHQYLSKRKNDQAQIINLTHSLIGVFSNSLIPVVLARNAGMILLDRIQIFKKLLTKRALGLRGKIPRLACGLTLE